MKSRQASFFLYWPVENEDDSLMSSDESAFHMRGKNRHMKQQKVLINKMKLNVDSIWKPSSEKDCFMIILCPT